MKGRLLYLLRFYAMTLLLFIAAKVVFMLCNATGHGVSFGDYTAVIWHGLSLDLSTALYFLIVPFLYTMASVWIRLPRWIMKVYYAIVAIAFALAFVADTSLYPFWGFKLDASCLQYLQQPEGITASVSIGYLIVRFVLLVLVAWLVYRVLARGARNEERGTRSASHLKDRSILVPRSSLLAPRIGETVLYILLMPLMVLGIRGGVHESTTNIGQVYYSQNQFLNHSAVNPVFSFLYSLSHQMGDQSQYEFFDDERCQQLVADVYTTESINTDTLLTTTRPDIVIILLESAGEEFAHVMPRLQQFKQEGISFSQCYGNSWRTDRGTVCTLSGYPSFPSVSVMKMPEKSRTLPAIARTLRGEGYRTRYLYGGDINFTNMRSYLISTGWEKLTSMDDYSSEEQSSAQWGVRDDITFDTLSDMIEEGASPFLIGYSTLSSHEPWDVPTHTIADDEILNAFAYLDTCLGQFVDSIRQTPAWQNLLIVLTADHGINYKDITQATPKEKNHIPMVWIGGAVGQPCTIDVLCNQTDLCATLLGQLRLPHDEYRFSRDVLSESYRHPIAVHNYSNAQWAIDSTGHALYDFDAHRFIVSESSDADRLTDVSKAILQASYQDLQGR